MTRAADHPSGSVVKEDAAGQRTHKLEEKLSTMKKITVTDESVHSPTITHVQGLTPVERWDPGRGARGGGRDRHQPKTRSRPSSSSQDKVKRPSSSSHQRNSAATSTTKMEATVNDADMQEIDLGDGVNDLSLAAATSKTSNNNNNKASSSLSRQDSHNGNAKPDNELKKPGDEGSKVKDTTGDTSSMYSLYMESDFRYYFQHPYVRLFVAYFVTLCNFLIYAEDPVAHSYKECNIPVIGNCFAFVGTRYPPNAWSLLKVVLWLTGTLVGMVLGKIIVHTLLFNRLFRLKMFTDDKGSWMTMFLSTILCVFIFSYIYNLFLLIGGDSTSDYSISPYMSVDNNIFMKAAAIGTWCGDFFTAWMVTDMMLQEKLYPMWAGRVRRWWNNRYNRIILFWIIVFLASFIVVFVIATDYIMWDKLNRDFLHSNELSRAFLASFILVMDIVIIMQDWDFPHFISAIDIKLPGINTAHIRFKIPRLLKKLEYWHVHISGKWFNYGILFIVILLDLNMWKNQVFYAPYDYGQYVDSEGRIHSVVDDYSLETFNQTMLSFDYRNSTVDQLTGKRYIELDTVMNARYNDYSIWVKAITFIPSVGIFIFFGVYVWLYGRRAKPTKDDPYGGRLKKRKRHLFRLGWKRLRKRFRTTELAISAFQDAGRDAKLRRQRQEEGGLGTEMREKVDGEVVDAKVVGRRWRRKVEGHDNEAVVPDDIDAITERTSEAEEGGKVLKRLPSPTLV